MEQFLEKDADAAKKDIIFVYGEKLGTKTYVAVKNAREGASYRKNGGPLVQVVSHEKADWIREKRDCHRHDVTITVRQQNERDSESNHQRIFRLLSS